MSLFKAALPAALGALVLLPAPAAAQSVNDVRCLVASNIFSKVAKGDKPKALAEASLYFYLGRIDGRYDAKSLKSAVTAQQKTLNSKNANVVMAECARQLQRSSKMVENATR